MIIMKRLTKPKYKNIKINNNYGKFDSLLEYRVFLRLLSLINEDLHIIKKQYPFLLIEKSKNTKRAVKYVADFVVKDKKDNVLCVVEAKGVETSTFKLKMVLFKAKYNYPLLIITDKNAHTLNRLMSLYLNGQ